MIERIRPPASHSPARIREFPGPVQYDTRSWCNQPAPVRKHPSAGRGPRFAAAAFTPIEGREKGRVGGVLHATGNLTPVAGLLSGRGLSPCPPRDRSRDGGPYGDRRRPASCASNPSRFFQRRATLALNGPFGDRRVWPSGVTSKAAVSMSTSSSEQARCTATQS